MLQKVEDKIACTLEGKVYMQCICVPVKKKGVNCFGKYYTLYLASNCFLLVDRISEILEARTGLDLKTL